MTSGFDQKVYAIVGEREGLIWCSLDREWIMKVADGVRGCVVVELPIIADFRSQATQQELRNLAASINRLGNREASGN